MKRSTVDGGVKSFRILPALAALAAAIAKPFRRKPKPTVYETALVDHPSRGHVGTRAPSLRGIGKASRQLRRARRRHILGSFTRLLAHKPMGVGPEASAWRAIMAKYAAHWQERAASSRTVRLGRRAQKRSARLYRRREVAIMRRAKREARALDVGNLLRVLVKSGGAA